LIVEGDAEGFNLEAFMTGKRPDSIPITTADTINYCGRFNLGPKAA
jgi:hypothetical protein